MLEQSQLVAKLTQPDIQYLQSEIDVLSKYWGKHNSPTALQEGKTIYIQDFNPILKTVKSTKFSECPNTYAILQRIAGNEPIKRCYWHKLMPGEKIYRHDDAKLSFVVDGSLSHRYQIYLDSDPNFVLELDNKVIPTMPWAYSIIDFALKKPHFYHNKSSKPWIFLVFDTFHNN
jgi:hypothetical protein